MEMRPSFLKFIGLKNKISTQIQFIAEIIGLKFVKYYLMEKLKGITKKNTSAQHHIEKIEYAYDSLDKSDSFPI